MKENNEVLQGDNTARGPSASGAVLGVGAVLSVLKDTKKLNAGIALMALQSVNEITGLKSEDFERVAVLVKRLTKTAIMQEIYTEDEPVSSVLDTALTEHAIAMIEEYLKEQGV